MVVCVCGGWGWGGAAFQGKSLWVQAVDDIACGKLTQVDGCVCVCVCVRETERENVCVCVCVCERERENVCVCVCEREREREREKECVCFERGNVPGQVSVLAVEDIAHGELTQVDGSVCVCVGGGGL